MEQKLKAKASAKKGFYEVEAPMTAMKISLYGSSKEEFNGKVIALDLTKSLRGKNLELRMRVKHEDNKLRAEPISLNLAGSYIRRAMRRGTDYVEDSFETECRDYIIKIKALFITRMRVSRKIRKALRDEAKKYIQGYIKIRTAKELFSEIMTGKLQKGMALKLKKIYPLAFCEIRVFKLGTEKPEEEKKLPDKSAVEAGKENEEKQEEAEEQEKKE